MPITNDKQLKLAIEIAQKLMKQERYERAFLIFQEVYVFVYATCQFMKYYVELKISLVCSILCNIKTDQYKIAIELIENALIAYEHQSNERYVYLAWKAECYLRLRDVDNAMEAYINVIQNINKISMKHLRNEVRFGFSFLMMHLRNKNDAIDILNKIEIDDNIPLFCDTSVYKIKDIFSNIDFDNKEKHALFYFIFDKYMGKIRVKKGDIFSDTSSIDSNEIMKLIDKEFQNFFDFLQYEFPLDMFA